MQSRICDLLKIKKPELEYGYLQASGATVPTDTTEGYRTGCLFIHTDGAAESALYVNEGSVTSCAFVPVLTTSNELQDLPDFGAMTYGAGKVLVADGDSYEEVAVSGDATLASSGALTIATGAVEDSMIEGLSASQFILGVDGTAANNAKVVMSGDGTLSTAGALTITKSTGAFVVGTNLSLTTGFFNIGAQGAGAAVSTASPFAAEIHATVAADIVPGATGSSAGVYSRYEVAADQTTQCSHISMFGKLRVKADLGDGTHAGMFGYVEISEVGTVIGGTATTTTAAGHFAIESDTNFELSTGHLNGICVDSSVHASATITGTMVGIRIKKSTGKKAWPIALDIEGSSCVQAIRVGDFDTGGATTNSVAFSADMDDDYGDDGQLDVVAVFGSSASDLTNACSAKCARFRHVVNATTIAHETYGAVGQCVVKDTTLNHLHAGLMGTFEGHTSGVVCGTGSGYSHTCSAVLARCGGGAAITASSDLCGYLAFWNGAALASGESDAFAVTDSGTVAWTNALSVSRVTNLLDLPADGTAPVAAGNYEVHGGTKVRISVLVGGQQYYMLASTAPTTQS